VPYRLRAPFLLLCFFLFGCVVVEFYLYILFHLLIVGKVQLEVVFTLHEIAVSMTVSSANSWPDIINFAAIVFFRKMFALVLNVYIPIAVLYEHCDIFMAQIPSYIIVIGLIFRRFNRQCKIPAAQPRTLITLTLFGHYNRLQIQ